jgi:signal transduction histidine kinase
VKADEKKRIVLGGKSAFNWRLFGWALPIIIFEPPITESSFSFNWSFWRWTLATLISTIPMVILFALGDFYFFGERIGKPVKDWLIFGYGAIIGAVFGATLGLTTYYLHIQNEAFILQITQRSISYGLIGMLLLPFGSLLVSAVEVYNSDREALIAERMLIESQKAESRAVINSLRSSLSNKVDENLLQIIENSKEYFNTKTRSLEENWELLAERLRRAALDTIRPFSHTLHRRGEEITYRVRLNELASYIAYKFDIHIFLTLFVYLVTTHYALFTADVRNIGLKIVGIRMLTLFILLAVLKILSKLRVFHKLWAFSILLVTNSLAFLYISNFAVAHFDLVAPNSKTNIFDAALISALVVLISLGMAFLHGGHAEIEFLERRISEEQLETMLLRREEARISRELAKYLHGTIQSRLMASAIGLESAGKRGDVKALQKEAKTAYKNLKLPSEKYFSNPEVDLKAEVEKVVAKWKGLIEVKLSIPKTMPNLASDLVQDIGNVINEGLSNAFRHGIADQVKIAITFTKAEMLVVIEDNGMGPANGSKGLGSEWFDAIAGSKWELTKNAKAGATLTLQVNVR